MRTLAACGNVLAAALLAAALAPSSLPAAPAPPEKEPAADTPPKVREVLERVVSLKIDRQSLTAVVALLRDKTKLNIVLDTPAFQQLGITPDQPPVPVQADLKDVKVWAALQTVLAPYDLTFVVVGGEVVVTSQDAAAARQMAQHVSVHLDKMRLADALKQLAGETGVNLPLDPRTENEAAAKVSLDVDDVPLETAVRLLSEMACLKPVRVGNVLFVTKKEVAAAMRDDPALNPPRQVSFNDPDLGFVINARIMKAQGRLIGVAPGMIAPPAPIGVGTPIGVKSTDETAPANPDSPPAPEKKDGDK